MATARARSAFGTGVMAVTAALALLATGCGGSPAAPHPAAGPGSHAVATTGAATPSTPSTPSAPVRLQVRRLPIALSQPLSDTVVFSYGLALLIAGGLTAADTTTAAVTKVDFATGTVTPDGRLAEPVHDAAGLVAGGADLILGGGTATSVSAVQAVVPGGTGQIAASLPEPRSDLAAASTGGFGYVLGGYTGARMLSDVLRTTDGRTFTRFASLPVPVRYPALVAAGGYLWLLGGMTGDGHATDDIQRVDTATGTVTIAGHLPRALSHAAGFALAGQVFLAGGRLNSSAVSDQILRVGAAGGTATVAATLPTGLSDAGVGVLDGTVYLVGGESPRTTGDIIMINAAG